MKVLHFYGTAILGRSPQQWYEEKFLNNGIELVHHPEPLHPYIRHGLENYIDELVEYANDKKVQWLFFGWEMFRGFKQIWEHPKRKFKVLIYAQEQPQRLGDIPILRGYCDKLYTSAPTFQGGTDGYIPFPVHTAFGNSKLGTLEKRKQILISGSFRQCRYELFERLLTEQPFKWPVKFLPSGLQWEPIGKMQYEELIQKFPEHIVAKPKSQSDYIPVLLSALSSSMMFIDCTFNPYPELKMSQAHTSLDDVFAIKDYKGGYMPERVLDACNWGCYPICLKNPAIDFCLGEKASYYDSYDGLVNTVSQWINKSASEQMDDLMALVHLMQSYSTETIIEKLSNIFKEANNGGYTGRYD